MSKKQTGGPAFPHKPEFQEGDTCPKCGGAGNAPTPEGITLADGPFPCSLCYGRGELYNHNPGKPDWPPAVTLGQSSGMTLRQYAAIKLKVPDSGADWLDEMIRKSLCDGFAGQAIDAAYAYISREVDGSDLTEGEREAMAGCVGVTAYEIAVAMMARQQEPTQ